MLQLINELSDSWSASDVFTSVEAALSTIGFSDSYVESAIAEGPRYGRTKVIKDGVWGMIEAEASHLRLLDCPILQRLRTIHQLGFSYLTYPSAEHSRFAHSLGMFSVVSKFLTEIGRRELAGAPTDMPYDDWKPDRGQVLLAEHAAILHDIGHMPFSHVTEQILSAQSNEFRCGPLSVDDFTFPAENLLEKDKLAELLSVAIVLSPRFRRFYCKFVNPEAGEDVPARIAALILGVPAEPMLAGVANLISGSSIDADKIDYINRDARACGIAVGIDVSRLFMRSRFLIVKPQELQRLRLLPAPPALSEAIFVVNASGLDSIEEIGQARTMLYHRVYLHQTTRNAERLLGKALQACLAEPVQTDLLDALQLWTLDDFGLLRKLSGGPNPTAAEAARRVSVRQLPKRASAFGRRFVDMSVPFAEVFPKADSEKVGKLRKQILGTALDELRDSALKGKEQVKLEALLWKEAASLADLIRAKNKPAPSGAPLISVLPMPNIEENREDLIILDNEQLNRTSASSVVDEQMEAADIMKSTGYVLCDPAWRNLVFLATRKVFYERSKKEHAIEIEPFEGDKLTVQAVSRAMLDEQAVAQRIRLSGSDMASVFATAASVGYFDSAPRLVPHRLNPNQILRAANRFSDFTGQGNWKVGAASVEAFLLQFPDPLRQEVLDLLSSFSTLERSELVSSVREGLNSLAPAAPGHGFVTSLSPDSGGSVRTVAEHELRADFEHTWTFAKTIRDVFETAAPGDTLVLSDDNVTSGSQAHSQFLAWMGVPRTEWPMALQQEGGIERAALSARDQTLLKQLEIWIVVAKSGSDAELNLKTALMPLGLNFRGIKARGSLNHTRGTLSPALSAHLEKIGTSVLGWCRHRAKNTSDLSADDLAACQRDSVGYSGASALMCTTLNVPVGTITAFWAPWYADGEPWMPLLIRRGYLKHLVLS